MGSGNAKKFEWKLGSTGLIIVIIGTAILLCLSFLLGVGVGKNMETYPEKISSVPHRILSFFWRPARVAVPEKPPDIRESKAEKDTKELAFHDALTSQKLPPIQQQPAEAKKAESDVMEQIIADRQAPKADEAPKAQEVASKEAHPESQTVKKPTEAKKTPGNEASAHVSSPSTAYVIHVASLKDKAKAGQIHKTITAMGYTARIVKADLQGKGTWYRVMATGFASKAQAQAAAEKIDRKAKTRSIIRPAASDAGLTGKN